MLTCTILISVHFIGVVQSASYYQREYSDYLLKIPGFNDAEKRSQLDAQIWCSGNGSKLLAITTPSIQSAAVAFINDAIAQNQMTGNPIITDGQRSTGDWTWINGTPSSTTLQIGGQAGGLSSSYAYLYVPPAPGSFSLYASTPAENKYFICEGQVFCGNGYQIQGQCFQSFANGSDQLSWFEARNRCLQRGGDLATFEFITTNDGLEALSGSWLRTSTQYWIGLRRQWWTWQSINSNVTYSQWSDGHPIYDVNQQCICLLPNTPIYDWKWNECNCNQTYQFVCISSPASAVTSTSKSMTTGLSSTTEVTIKDNDQTSKTSGTQNSAQTQNDSSLAIGLGVGLGVGLPLLLVILILAFIVIRMKRKSRKSESSGISSGNNGVEMASTPTYESLQNGATMHGGNNSISTYDEVINTSGNNRAETITATPTYESLQTGTTMDSGSNSNSTYDEVITTTAPRDLD